MSALFGLLVAWAATGDASAAALRQQLFVIELQAVAGAANLSIVHRLDFLDGVFQGQREVLRSDEIGHFSWNTNKIVANRYSDPDRGRVIDLVEGRLVRRVSDRLQFLGMEGDRGYYGTDLGRVGNERPVEVFAVEFRQSGVSRLHRVEEDARTWRWFAQADADFDERRMSPDGNRYAATQSGPLAIVVHERGKEPRTIADDLRMTFSEFVSSFPIPPVLWLGGEEILTQDGNGRLIAVNLRGERREIVRIPLRNEAPFEVPRLDRDLEGTIVYSAGDAYAIDAVRGTAEDYRWVPQGDGFYVGDGLEASGNLRPIRHQDRDLGRCWCSIVANATAPGCIALLYGDEGSNLGYPKGVRVWTAATAEWREFDFTWVDGIVGWLSFTADER